MVWDWGFRPLRLGVLLIGALILLPHQVTEASEVFLSVTRSETVRIPLSLIHVSTPDPLARHTSIVGAVLEGDLRRSQIFSIIPSSVYPELAGGAMPHPELLKKIGSQEIQVAVWIALMERDKDKVEAKPEHKPQPKDLVLEGRVYDTQTGQMVMGKRYIGEVKNLRSIVHHFADDIVFQYTGERGISGTRIVFTSKLTGNKELYIMDYDGYNVRKITNNRSINLSPKWSPDGMRIVYTSYRTGRPVIYDLNLRTGRLIKMIEFN